AGLHKWAGACIAGILLAGTVGAMAQTAEEPPARALTGALQRIKETGAVRIGYREHAIPFSFAGADGRPNGYSIDICQAIVENIAEAAGVAALRTEYRRVTPADRLDQVAEGRIDLECGSTTNTAERRRRVAFSPLIYIAGTRLLVKRGSPVRSARDLPGRRVVVARGTTNEAAMRQLAAAPGKGFVVDAAEDYPQALARLAAGEADVLAADDILIAGYLAEKGLRRQYAMVGDLLSFEPYGIMFARDDTPLAEAVAAAFGRLAATREIRWIYNKWFLRGLPSGIRLGLPMDPRLERSFQVLGLPPE
ncbi:MAG TPA: amino acid ABC transporter substrate-binding protein, partial [Burkholderiales bacterium]